MSDQTKSPQPDPLSEIEWEAMKLRANLVIAGYWPRPGDLVTQARDDGEMRAEICSQVQHLNGKMLLSLMSISSIFTLAHLEGVEL